jgi:hypothetical protein
MNFINADKLRRKSGGMGYHGSQPSTLLLNQGLQWGEIPEWREP